jgi:YD repeat-containing protein
MRISKPSCGPAGNLARLLVAFMLLLVAFGANADDTSDCTSRYAKSGAIPGTKSCALNVASNTPGGPGGYACLNNVDLIKQWCAGETDPQPEKSCPVADPVYPGSGAVTLDGADFVSGDDIPMVFSRTYRSASLGASGSAMGPVWVHNWQRQLNLANANNGGSSKVVAFRENGEPVTFNWSGGYWRTAGFTGLALAQSGSGWTLTNLRTETIESYSAQGVLLTETTKTGFVRTLSYDSAGLLTTITQHAIGTDASNDITLRLDYDDKRRVSRLNDPLGRMTQYGYDANSNLVSITWPGGYTHRYVYDDARFKNALTGEIDEAGNRIATWNYDAQGRAVAVSHPDTVRNVQFAYNSGSTVITSSKGATTLNMSSIGGVLRPTGTTSTAGNTSSTWDASGNLLKDADASGGTSEYGYDDSGRPVKATVKKASGTSISEIRYADATSLRPSMIASPGLIQSFVYDAKGNVTGIAETPTSDATGANGFAALKADGGVTVAYGITYDVTNRPVFVQQQADGKVTGQWTVTRDATGNAWAIIAQGEIPKATKMISRDAAHRVLYGYNPTGDFSLRYDQRARIDLFQFYEYASPANGGISRVFNVRFSYSPDGQVVSRTGTVAKNGNVLALNAGTAISDDEINQWIDNYNYGDSPVGPPANLQGARQLLLAGSALGTSTVCTGCHFSAGLIDGSIREIAFVWRLVQNPAVRYGIGQGARKVAENWERIKEMCKPAAETEVDGIPPGRVTSKYEDITEGNSVTNIETDVTKAEFEANLRNNGWTQTLSKDGKADIFTKDGVRYTVRDESNAGKPTADFTPAGATRPTLKIRLPKP